MKKITAITAMSTPSETAATTGQKSGSLTGLGH